MDSNIKRYSDNQTLNCDHITIQYVSMPWNWESKVKEIYALMEIQYLGFGINILI